MKIKPLALVNIVLATVLLTSIVFSVMTGNTSSSVQYPYDPWVDHDHDGDIDIYDVVYLCARYGSKGTPINTTALLLELLSKIDSLNTTVIELENTINYLNTTVINLNETVIYLNSTFLGNIPIGTILPWAKNLAGVPAIPDNFVECNGQILDDPESLLHGQIMPNLNGFNGGTQRFLRGSTTSGAKGGSDTHSHTGSTGGVAGWSGKNHVQSGSNGIQHYHDFVTDESSSLPSYYEVVWIMRVK